jgi:hypothetical protein
MPGCLVLTALITNAAVGLFFHKPNFLAPGGHFLAFEVRTFLLRFDGL